MKTLENEDKKTKDFINATKANLRKEGNKSQEIRQTEKNTCKDKKKKYKYTKKYERET